MNILIRRTIKILQRIKIFSFSFFMLPKPVENLIKQFSHLPGIGPKFAERLVFFMANEPREYSKNFAFSLLDFSKKIKNCSLCGHISEELICPICQDPKRDSSIVCLVENSSDIIALEKTGQYHGLYHTLGGLISPYRHILPENLRIKELLSRVNNNNKTKEIIIATNPTVEGDATAFYIAKIFESSELKITRLGRGLPTGGELEYMDETTLINALGSRKKI